jgi:D-tyrosyl-tRNA(Tyr) deacylase
MRALVQRVSQAAVDVEGERVAQIGPGMLVLLGVRAGDTVEQCDRLADKVRALRVFDDAEGRRPARSRAGSAGARRAGSAPWAIRRGDARRRRRSR